MDLSPVWITLELAVVTTVVLLGVATPIAYWLAFSRSRVRPLVEAVTSLPLVLPPTVLGFYLLLFLGPEGWAGRVWEGLGGARLVFSFPGLVIGSVVYSLPFVVQPLTNALSAVDRRVIEAAATLGAGRLDRFATVIVPMCRRGFATGATLGFAHTVGEFGVVLMLGGNIPGETQVISIAIYDHVESMSYGDAHLLSAGMVLFSLTVLLFVHAASRRLEVFAS